MTNPLIHLECALPCGESAMQWCEPAPACVFESSLDHARPESSDFCPEVRFRLSASTESLSVLFKVEDRYVIARPRQLNGPVHLDSCVEMFIQPPGSAGYINFELNAIGNLHASFIRNPERTAEGFADFRRLTSEELGEVKISGGLEMPTESEIEEPVSWMLGFEVPWDLFRSVSGISALDGEWKVNFYKCADESSHPHWLSWSPVRALNFHQPEDFGTLCISGVPGGNHP